MDEFSESHKLIKFLLSVVGLWPYERTCFAYAKRATHTLLVSSGIAFQVSAFLHKAVYTQSAIVTFVTNITLAAIIMYKHTAFLYQLEFVRESCDTISRHRTIIADEHERRIVFKNIADVNARNRSFATIFYTSICGYLLYNLLTNNCNDCKDNIDIHIKMYYFSDNPIFVHVLHLHVFLFMVFGTTSLIGPELSSVIFSNHVCTLYQIIRHRVRTAFAESSGIADFEKDRLIMDKLISATKMHHETIKYAGQLSNSLASSYFILLSLGVVSLSFNLLRMAQSVQQQRELKELLIQLILIIVHVLYLFLTNYICQIVMDNSSELFTELCNCRWYTASVRTQKLLLFLIHYSAKTYNFLIGGLFVPSYEGYGRVLKMSFSYFAVMYSAPV